MKASVRLGVINAVVGLAILVISMGILYPLTKSIIVFHMPIMNWGFLILGIAFVIQCYVFMGKVEKLESMENGQEGGEE
jgi:hypothetical protein